MLSITSSFRRSTWIVLRRELSAYFYSPIAYVFLSIFVLTISATTIFLGGFFESNNASLDLMFAFMPWVLIFLVPAIGMHLWAEEQSSGSIELLLTLPIEPWQTVLAKFLAGWIFIAIALLMTILFPITIFVLGSPDLGQLLTGYLGSFFMAGVYLAISCFASALTNKQVISFVLSFVICFFLSLMGWGLFSNLLNQIFPVALTDFITSLGVIAHFENFGRGIIDFRDVSYFLILIGGSLALNVRLIQGKRS